MRIGQLKEILNQFNDDAEVIISGNYMGFNYTADIVKIIGVKVSEGKDVLKALSVEYSKAPTCVLASGIKKFTNRG